MIANKETIINRLDILEYKDYLYSVEEYYLDKRLEYYRLQALSVNADYFYCFDSLLENISIPFVYVYDQRERNTVNLVEINKKLWTLGEIALAIIVYQDEFKIIDTRKPIESKTKPAYFASIGESIKIIDKKLKRKIFEGRILEESPTDYLSVSPYQKLLDHIEKKILKRSNIIGCTPELLRKLLVKFILIKYLEEQVDEEGNSVFGDTFFDRFMTKKQNEDLFSRSKYTFCDVLREGDIIELLNFLNGKFNGGIFKIQKNEEFEIQKANLKIVANALDGNVDLDGQMSIWRYYDFNLLPIEFISRLYESFVVSVEGRQKGTGAYYTPPHLARLLIDELLPFDKEIDFKNFKILDPSCGSGIFLVLAYKRLITLWMLQNNKSSIKGETDILKIKSILLNSIYGVDINSDALSITATSLQIELSSHIMPKEIWEKLTFDNLEEKGNLINIGFFKWYQITSITFDIIAGNPPFNISKEEYTKNIKLGNDNDFSKERYKDYNGKLQYFPNNNPALIFLHRCLAKLLKENEGILFMIMPSSSFLYMPSSSQYRKSLAHYWHIRKIYDFTPLRNHLWGKKKVATVAVKITNESFSSKFPIEHIIVRNSSANEKGAVRFQIDKYDKFKVPLDFVFSKDYIWKTNLLGGGFLRLFIEKYLQGSTKVGGFCKNKGWKRSNGSREDASSDKQIDMYGKSILNSDLFIEDIITKDMIYSEKKHILRRAIPKTVATPPNILIRLNINYNLPIVYNEKYNVNFRPGVLGLKSSDNQEMADFVSLFIQNRELYMLLIKATSPKIFIQQSNSYTVDGNDILNLPINTDKNGDLMPYEEMNIMDKAIMDDTNLLADNINNYESPIYNPIVSNSEILFEYSNAFCDILNMTYETGEYKFITSRQIINDDYIWITFEHTDKNPVIETEYTTENQILFSSILSDNTSNNALTVNRIITSYIEGNKISFIKPNKLKYWMRTIAYRDAENVKSEMFKNGY